MPKLMTFDQTEKDIIDYIKQARLKKGITQKQLAEMVNVSLSLIGTAESYKNKYSKSTIKKIFKALNIVLPEEKKIIDISVPEIDLFPGSTTENKIKIMISDRFIDNIDDLKNLQFTNKGNLLIDEGELFEPFREDFKINSQNYYAVILNDGSLVPFASKGDYLIINFIDKYDYESYLSDESRMKMYIIKEPNNNKIFRYIKSISNYTHTNNNENLLYAFFFYHMPPKVIEAPIHITGDFYFREGELKIIGKIVVAINPRLTISRF